LTIAAVPGTDPADVARLVSGALADPHHLLGWHEPVLVARHLTASALEVLLDASATAMTPAGEGIFFVELATDPGAYRLRATLPDGTVATYGDPYRLWPTLGEVDLHLFGEGRHHRLWEVLGAHAREHQGETGVAFAVWAPAARSVRVVGDWNGWDGRAHPMRSLGASGVWELFVPGVGVGERYKFEILSSAGGLVTKADPLAREAEVPPGTASVVAAPVAHRWSDEAWMASRDARRWPGRERLSVYEVHLPSWRRVPEEGDRPLTYRELAEQLPAYAAGLGFTHVELLPVAAHPFEGSWGYQVSSYYAPSPRQGSPDDFRALVDACHAAGLGVLVDWVPAHFPRDSWALARFDGTACYEHADPREGEHPDWGTLVFNYGRHEVRNFLVANALYWLESFHVDGLRVDAVASMLYRDYSRKEGEWIPNAYGGRENLEAVAFLRELNEVVAAEHPGAITVAEESTAWPAVSRPTYLGGLGFSFKWNMGWMHDTLRYFSLDPVYRRYHQGDLTFGLLYAFSENFVLPLSHDEVVHGKGSLLEKMPGDAWQRLANLRALFGWMWAHPGKTLLFMGAELAQGREWSHERSLDWHLLDEPGHAGVTRLVGDLNRVSAGLPALWAVDFEPEGFRWIDASDADANVACFLRFGTAAGAGVGAGAGAGVGAGAGIAAGRGAAPGSPPAGSGPSSLEAGGVVACLANLSPVPRAGYRVGLPAGGQWREVLNTDAADYGGSGVGNLGGVVADGPAWHGLECSAEVTLPPLGVVWLTPGG